SYLDTPCASTVVFRLAHSPAPSQTHTLSLHDALPIYSVRCRPRTGTPPRLRDRWKANSDTASSAPGLLGAWRDTAPNGPISRPRSEEHTSELQSRFDLVCRLLLEKKNSMK